VINCQYERNSSVGALITKGWAHLHGNIIYVIVHIISRSKIWLELNHDYPSFLQKLLKDFPLFTLAKSYKDFYNRFDITVCLLNN